MPKTDPATSEETIDRFEVATRFALPTDYRSLVVEFAGEGLLTGPGMVPLAVKIPSFYDPATPDLVGYELSLLDLPAGGWVDRFLDFDGLVGVQAAGSPAQAELIRRSPFLNEHRDWAVSLVPVFTSHGVSALGNLCFDFFDAAQLPPVVFVQKGMAMGPTDPNWEGIWYVAESVTAMLDPANVEEFDYEAESFPLDIKLDAGLDVSRVPTEAELLWNQRRDERLGRKPNR